MTIYIHFMDKTKPSIKLYNVESVSDGYRPHAVVVRLQFQDNVGQWENVSHVAVQPSTE